MPGAYIPPGLLMCCWVIARLNTLEDLGKFVAPSISTSWVIAIDDQVSLAQ